MVGYDAANYIMAIFTGLGCARHTIHCIIKSCHILYYMDGQ